MSESENTMIFGKPKYFATDIETGGIDGKYKFSLLTLYGAVLDSKFNTLSEIELYMKPNDGAPYQIDPSGMAVNKIDLIKHDAMAITMSEAGSRFYNFLKVNSGDGKNKLTPLGHGISFDVHKINSDLLSRENFEKFASYRRVCTHSVGAFLKDAGIIPDTVSGSLISYVQYFGIPDLGCHAAKNDTLMTIQVYQKFLGLIIKKDYGNIYVEGLSEIQKEYEKYCAEWSGK